MAEAQQGTEGVHILRCKTCGLESARIENGVLTFDSRHHGEKHKNIVALPDDVWRALTPASLTEGRTQSKI